MIMTPAIPPPAIAIPPEVQMLPMGENEFADQCPNTTHEWVQARWFLGQMLDPSHCGRYRHHVQGLDATPGAIVLFRFKNQIVATATFVRRERYPQPHEGYHGELWFDPCSVRIFEPVDLPTIQTVWPEAVFSNAKSRLDPARYPAFLRLLRGVAAPVLIAPPPT
jgi:hypothetical protein